MTCVVLPVYCVNMTTTPCVWTSLVWYSPVRYSMLILALRTEQQCTLTFTYRKARAAMSHATGWWNTQCLSLCIADSMPNLPKVESHLRTSMWYCQPLFVGRIKYYATFGFRQPYSQPGTLSTGLHLYQPLLLLRRTGCTPTSLTIASLTSCLILRSGTMT